MLTRLFDKMLANRAATGLALLLLCALLAWPATKVRPDHSVEHFFPVSDSARTTYDAFKKFFPNEDARAVVVVTAPDIFELSGLQRLERLESELAKIAGVVDVRGPMSVKNIVAVEDGVRTEKLFPSSQLDKAALAHAKELATSDRLFAWTLAKPDGSAVLIEMVIDPEVATHDSGRRRFLADTRAVLASNSAKDQRLVLAGVPLARSRFSELIDNDTRLVPVALVIVLVLLMLVFRSVAASLAGLVTIAVSLLWTYGAMGLLGIPINSLLSIMPVIVVVISVSDTVHIVNQYFELRRNGRETGEALVAAMAACAMPCLATEVVLAAGFASLMIINIVAISQFGLVTAIAMLLTWFANMTVLPLLLSLAKPKLTQAPGLFATPVAVRWSSRLVGSIERVVVEHPKRVMTIALVIGLGTTLVATRIKKLSFAFDDLRPTSPLFNDLRLLESTRGGIVPVAIWIDSGQDTEAAALDPELVRLADRAAVFLRTFPEIKQAHSVADYLRKAHRAFAGDQLALENDGLPSTRSLIVQEIDLIDDGRMMRDVLSADRRSLAAFADVADSGSPRAKAMLTEMKAWVALEQAALDARGSPAKIHITGILRIFDAVNDTLVEGLLGSFAGSLLISLLVMGLVLRSWRLALVGLVPNLAPILLVTAFMPVVGIDLKASTVMLFSIVLVVAEDDTIQYLTRFRTKVLAGGGGEDPHRRAALECLREVGVPMFVTSVTVSLGFLILQLSEFQGVANLGALLGAALFSAVFADLFLLPLLLSRLRPLAPELKNLERS